ncbi:MAG: hypothetical protein IKL52_01485, partial [Candidatus Gastranaerophilales bacterium]|nr:hypothetical protein [Candidatus Gastranaerophilales bacterium]
DAQFNVTTNHTDAKTPLADMEVQIRGPEVQEVAEVEHIPYDIRQGKITATDPRYAQYYALLKGMSQDSYDKYNEYLNNSYVWAVLRELNLTTDAQKPKLEEKLFFGDEDYLRELGLDISLAGKMLTPEEIEKITLEGLAKYKVK